MSKPDFGGMRQRMVDDQIVYRGMRDEGVLAAMRSVPRHLFVPDADWQDAYTDAPLPIGYGQTISQPFMVALMTALLGVDVRSKVLEIGAGSGYQTAVLAEVAGEVYAVERIAPLAERARAVLGRIGYRNVHLVAGDGTNGWPEEAPFAGILVAAAAVEMPQPLLDQLADGGRLVMPLGPPRRDQTLTIVERHGDAFARRDDTRCRFVPLVSGGAGSERHGGETADGQAAGEPAGTTEMEVDAVKAVAVKVQGRVQGVYYRRGALTEARRLGLAGWVRNLSDGGVALHLQGAPAAVDEMLAWCRLGPAGADVSGIDVRDTPEDATLTGFEVRG